MKAEIEAGVVVEVEMEIEAETKVEVEVEVGMVELKGEVGAEVETGWCPHTQEWGMGSDIQMQIHIHRNIMVYLIWNNHCYLKTFSCALL